ncbi:MAG TPA: hypothetical protein VGM10_31240 [Actinocrinis sp.]
MSTPTADPLAALADLPGVPAAIAEARSAVDRLRGHRVLRSRSAEVTAESALRGSRASAALAGADWPLEELRRRTDFGNGADAAPVRGALRISAELSSLLPVFRQAPAQALTRLHMLAAAGAVPADRIGRPRMPGEPAEAEPGWATGAPSKPETTDSGPADGSAGAAASQPSERLEAPADSGAPSIALTPLSPVPAEAAAQRLGALTGILAAPGSAPALVVAAVSLGESLCACPFGWGDGLVGRAVFRLALAARGLDPQSLAVPEAGMVELGPQARQEALTGYASGTAAGLSGWIAFCARALELGALESTAVCEALMRG